MFNDDLQAAELCVLISGAPNRLRLSR